MIKNTYQTELIGQLLLNKAIITEKDIKQALMLQEKMPGRFGNILIRMGIVTEENFLPVLAEQLNLHLLQETELPLENPQAYEIMFASGIDKSWWLAQELILWQIENTIRCIAKDILDPNINEFLATTFSQKKIEYCLVKAHDFERIIEFYTQIGTQHEDLLGDSENDLKKIAQQAPVIDFVNNMFNSAVEKKASDIHIEPEEKACNIRFRIDGILQLRFTIPQERYRAIGSRLKLISGLDIAERRLPQDGRINLKIVGQEIDIRVSTLPGIHGESIVLRLLTKDSEKFTTEALGFESDHETIFLNWSKQPHGIILVTGPTGSGKSTTLYVTLKNLRNGTRKIITVEDPVEYQLEGVTQIQTQSEIGYTFAKALRSILRQDPDIIMIGEIRDKETAEIAIQASLTGHMVLSTLHTNDAVSAFTRLIDMGIEPFLVATPIRAVIAQRLVRKLCLHCKETALVTPVQYELLKEFSMNHQNIDWKQAKGCQLCSQTGYYGRIGIYELIEVTSEIKEAIIKQNSPHALEKIARKNGYRSLRNDALIKASKGITSLDEVLRLTSDI